MNTRRRAPLLAGAGIVVVAVLASASTLLGLGLSANVFYLLERGEPALLWAPTDGAE